MAKASKEDRIAALTEFTRFYVNNPQELDIKETEHLVFDVPGTEDDSSDYGLYLVLTEQEAIELTGKVNPVYKVIEADAEKRGEILSNDSDLSNRKEYYEEFNGIKFHIYALENTYHLWPTLTKDAWKSMTVEMLNDYLRNNDVEARGACGSTALMYASEYNSSPEVIKFFIDNGADVHARGVCRWTVLMVASAYTSNPEVIQLLIDNGADLHAREEDGGTPLMVASRFNDNPEVIQLLIDNGSDVDARTENGWTALMWASSDNSNPEVIQVLIDNGVTE